jgi:hypothetical protein
MGKEISLIAFLSKVVSRNTLNYRKDFEFSGQSRTCYPLVEPTGLLGHLLRGQKPLKY